MINIVETWGQFFFKNIKTCYISMLLLTKKIIFEYCALVLKIHQDVGTISQIAHNLEFPCDLEVMLTFYCIMPMLEKLNEFD